jgi:hypothetical protein
MPELLKKEEETVIYSPSEKEQKIIDAIWSRWQKANDQRTQSYRYFNDRSLIEYVNDSVDRFNGYIEPRMDPAGDWGAKVFNNVTRSKTVAIIANITAERVRAEFFPQDQLSQDDMRAAQLIKHVEDYTYYKNKDDQQQFFTTLEAAVKGTAIGYEGYKLDKRKIKEIEDFNPETGEVKFKDSEITDWDDVYGENIPLFDFYPGNIYEREMQKQPFVIWRTVLDEDVFRAEFEKYKNVDKVQTSAQMMGVETQENSGDDEKYVTEGVKDDMIEVIRYFNKWTDEFHIIANGVLLTKTSSPLPWDHKSYPFWSTIFEPFAEDFFYGKSVPDKMRSNQDILNTLYRMMLDQTFLSINPPILTQGVENIRDEGLYPGRRISMDDVGNSKIMEIPGPQPAHFQIMKMVEDNLKKESLDDPSSGTSGSRTSAFEVGVSKEAAQKLLSLFLRCLEWGVRDKTELRVKNILQFYRLPKYGELDPSGLEAYRRVVIDDTNLADGTKGRQVIQMTPSEDKLPTKNQITGAEVEYMKQGENVAFSFMTTDLLKNLDLKIKIIPNSSLKMSEALKRALELDYQGKVTQLYPDMLNREEGFREFNEAFDKDPQKMKMQSPSPTPMEPGAPAGPGAGPSAGPSSMTPNSAAAAGVPTANSTSNSMRNMAAV